MNRSAEVKACIDAFNKLFEQQSQFLNALMEAVDARARAEQREWDIAACDELLNDGEDSYVVNKCVAAIRAQKDEP